MSGLFVLASTTTSVFLDVPIEEERTPLPLLAVITAILIGMFIATIVATRKPRIRRQENQPAKAPRPRSDSWWNL
jgi:multisubunit Na+/H+ antiporter MnhC subunit